MDFNQNLLEFKFLILVGEILNFFFLNFQIEKLRLGFELLDLILYLRLNLDQRVTTFTKWKILKSKVSLRKSLN